MNLEKCLTITLVILSVIGLLFAGVAHAQEPVCDTYNFEGEYPTGFSVGYGFMTPAGLQMNGEELNFMTYGQFLDKDYRLARFHYTTPYIGVGNRISIVACNLNNPVEIGRTIQNDGLVVEVDFFRCYENIRIEGYFNDWYPESILAELELCEIPPPIPTPTPTNNIPEITLDFGAITGYVNLVIMALWPIVALIGGIGLAVFLWIKAVAAFKEIRR